MACALHCRPKSGPAAPTLSPSAALLPAIAHGLDRPSSTQKHLNQLCILKANTVNVLNSRAFAAVVSHGLRLPGCWQEARQERRHLPGHVPDTLCKYSVVPFAKRLPAQKVQVTGESGGGSGRGRLLCYPEVAFHSPERRFVFCIAYSQVDDWNKCCDRARTKEAADKALALEKDASKAASARPR